MSIILEPIALSATKKDNKARGNQDHYNDNPRVTILQNLCTPTRSIPDKLREQDPPLNFLDQNLPPPIADDRGT